jgi:hypothetical protein
MLMEGLGELASVTLHTDDGIVAQGVTRELELWDPNVSGFLLWSRDS